MFCVYGAFAVNNSVFDIGLMLFFGVVGYLFNRTGFATAPFRWASFSGRCSRTTCDAPC